MTEMANLNIKADATSVDKAKDSLKQFNAEAKNTGAAAREVMSATAQMAAQIKDVEAAYRAEYQSQRQSATATMEAAKASQAAATATQANAQAVRMSAEEYRKMTSATKEATAATHSATKAQQEITAAVLAGRAVTADQIKAVGGLSNAMRIMEDAHKSGAKAVLEHGKQIEEHGKKMAGSRVQTALFTRELLVLGREASRGDFTRMAGSATILAQSLGLLELLASPVVLAVIAVGAAVAGVAGIMLKGEKEFSDFQNSLTATGNYAGITADKFEDMATRIAKSQDVGIRSVKGAIAELVSSGKFTSDTIDLMVQNAEAFSKLTGRSADDIVKDYETMKGGVVRFAVKHEESFHDITLAQIDYINQLEKTGHHHEAELKLMEDINANIKDRMVPQYGTLQRVLHDVATAASNMWDKILGIGRPKSLEEQIGAAATRVTQLQGQETATGGRGRGGQGISAEIATAQAQLNSLRAQQTAQNAKAAADAKKAQEEDDKIRAKYDNRNIKSPRTKATPTDQTDTRDAQVDGAIAAAKAQELQSQLQITHGVQAQAALKAKIDQEQYEAKIAAINKMEADISNDRLNLHKKEQIHTLENEKLVEARTKANKDLLASEQAADALARHQLDMKSEELDQQAGLLEVQAQNTKSAYARSAIELRIQKLRQEEAQLAQEAVINSKTATDSEKELATKRLADMKVLADAENQLKEKELSLANAVDEASSAAGNFASALRSHNWSQAFNSLIQTIETVKAAFATQGRTAGFASAGGAIGSVLGSFGGTAGKIGNAIGLGAGVTSMASSLPGLAATILPGLADSGALMGGLSTLAAAAGPIGIAVAAVATLASLFLKPHPSNHAAITQFSGLDGFTAMSTGKETSDTTNAAAGASGTILQDEQALKAFGATLEVTVSKLDIGTRDMTHIFLSSGEELRSAIGDPAAAAETALQAVLKGAKFADETQQKLVDGMIAAGKGFDDITASLQNYKAVQDALKPINDQLLQLTNPIKFNIQQIQDAIKSQEDVLKTALGSGYLTATQYADSISKLSQIQVLQLQQAAAQDVSSAQGDLNKAYTDQSSAIKALKSTWDDLTKSLKTYRETLNSGAAAGLSPTDQYAADRKNYESTLALAQGGDQGAQGRLGDVSQTFLTTSRNYNASSPAYFKDLETVKHGVDSVIKYTQGQSDIAQRQLDALDAQVGGLVTVNNSVLSIATAINNLATAQAQYTAAIQKAQADAAAAASAATAASVATTANDNKPATATGPARPASWSEYATQNPDILAYYNSHPETKAKMSLEQFGLDHYTHYGKTEGRLGVQGFANGGWGTVGGTGGTDSKLIQFRASPGELVGVHTPGQMQSAQASTARMENLLNKMVGLLDGANQQRSDAHKEVLDVAKKQLSEAAAAKRSARVRKVA